MDNRKERLISLIFVLLIVVGLEIYFLTSPFIPILSFVGITLGALAICLYVFGISKVYFQE